MKHYFFSYSRKRQYLLFIGDVGVIAATIFISYAIRVYSTHWKPSLDLLIDRLSPWLILIILIHIMALYVADQYNLSRITTRFRAMAMTSISIWIAGAFISGLFFFFPKYVFGRRVLLINLLLLTLSLNLWRLFFLEFLTKNGKTKRLALAGCEGVIQHFIEELNIMPTKEFEIVSIYISKTDTEKSVMKFEQYKQYNNVIELLEIENFDILAFDSTTGLFSDNEIHRILQLKYQDKAVFDLPKFYEGITGKVPINYIDGRWLLSQDSLQGAVSKPYIRLKRTTDVLMSFLGLLVFSPIILLLAFAVWAERKGSVFYSQERLGMSKKPFVCYKFRTMIEDAEKESGPVWSKKDDHRVTRLGKILRKTRLDELPQLINILKGDMSFVGPRPIREKFSLEMAEKVPFYWLRYDVKPGVTGWAQVNGAYAVPDGLETFQYELFYIQNMSFLLDLMTMFKTIHTVLNRKGK